jgi:hypothetical protein
MPIVREGTRFLLENAYLRREIDTAAGPVTTRYTIRPNGRSGAFDWLPLFAFEAHAPFEAAVCVGGRWWQAGPQIPATPTWERPGAYDVGESNIEPTALGSRLSLRCVPRALSDAPPLELLLTYELADDLPLLIQQVRVTNRSIADLSVDNVCVGITRDLRYGTELRVFTDYYWDTDCEDPYYSHWTRSQFPESIELVLAPGESFDTYRMCAVCTPNDPNAAAVATHRVIKALAPWITKNYVSQTFNGVERYEELEAIAPQAQADGIEAVHFFVDQIFPSCGDYVPKASIFPGGDDDVRRLVEHYHRHGLKVLPYCALTIATHNSAVWREHRDWEYYGPDGIRYNPGGLGNMCYQSGWGDYIASQMDHVLDLGFDGLSIDGAYHSLPCLAEHHRHRSPESVRFMNWDWERRFFVRMRERGVYVTAPQDWPALLLGLNARPGGYTEEDMEVMGGMALVTANRSRLYDWRLKVPACCSWTMLDIDEYHGHSIEASDENPASFDHACGATFGYGHFGFVHGRTAYIGPRTKAIFRDWITFYRTHRETLAGEHVHLARPDGLHADGIMHVNPQADPPALAVLFNPTGRVVEADFLLPLAFAGFRSGDRASVDEVGIVTLDDAARGTIRVTFEPYGVKRIAVRVAD